jgi:hypothetical protein
LQGESTPHTDLECGKDDFASEVTAARKPECKDAIGPEMGWRIHPESLARSAVLFQPESQADVKNA